MGIKTKPNTPRDSLFKSKLLTSQESINQNQSANVKNTKTIQNTGLKRDTSTGKISNSMKSKPSSKDLNMRNTGIDFNLNKVRTSNQTRGIESKSVDQNEFK